MAPTPFLPATTPQEHTPNPPRSPRSTNRLFGAGRSDFKLASLLFGFSPLDPITYAAVPAVLAGAAMLSSYLPTRRAASVDPVNALKEE